MQSMTPEELKAAYALSARPFIEAPGPAPESALRLQSWRYVLEINSQCNLKCAFCHAGNREGYQYKAGTMDMDLMERILDKIQVENPNAIVCCYVNSEPFLHPQIAQCVKSIKSRGFRCELSSNLNYVRDLEGVLAAKPDLFTVSLSGFTQPVYEKAHIGGNIETVKQNLTELSRINREGGYGVFIGVSYHMYADNLGEEMAQMKAFTENLGFLFMISWGRIITMENAVQACRAVEQMRKGSIEPFEVKGDVDLNKMLPPAKPEFLESIKRLRVHPYRAQELYSQWETAPVCLIADVFTEIRWDGKVQLCAWTDDMRLTLGNYLEMTQAEISEARRGHPLCRECLKYKLNYYFHILRAEAWDQGWPLDDQKPD